jgi:parvulin-like peptidyl-prolyl isomerase
LSLRTQLKKKLDNGSEFKDLAGQYSMDRNASRGGDLGWFQEHKMFSEFTNSLNTHTTGEVFFLDLEEKSRYYLIKKTDTSKDINLLTVLKVTL